MYKKKIIEFLKKKTNYNNILFSGRVNTLIWNLGLYLNKNNKRPKILMPSTLCVSPLIIFLNLKIKVEFIDIDPNTGLMNTQELIKKLKDDQYDLLFYVNLFGNVNNINLLKKIKSSNPNILIVQDLAQTFISSKITQNKKKLFGDLIFLSFGYSKIFDLGEGAILLSKNKSVYNFIYKKLLANYKNTDQINYQKKYLNWYNRFFLKNYPIKAKQTKSFAKKIYLKNFKNQLYKKIYNNILQLKKEEKRRYKLFDLYKKKFKSKKIKIIDSKNKFLPWRFSFLVNKNKEVIIQKLRKNNFNASSYYKSLNIKSKKSLLLEKKIINLWLDKKILNKDIEMQFSTIKNLI